MEDRLLLLIDDQEVESVRVYYYTIANSGKSAIHPNDFVEPIQVSTEEPWELLAVDTAWSNPPELEVSWRKATTNTFEMEPTLLNVGDTLQVAFFITSSERDNIDDYDKNPPLNWTARIVNVRSLDAEKQKSNAEISGLGTFYLIFHQEGWSLYFWVGVTTILFILGYWMYSNDNRLPSKFWIRIIVLSFILWLSITSADTIITVLFRRRFDQWWGAGYLLIVHILVFVYFAIPFIITRYVSLLHNPSKSQEKAPENEITHPADK